MTPNITALVGLSGVGKSTMLKSFALKRIFQHLSASQLIREARRDDKAATEVDSLRHANIDENQRLLIAGFNHAVDVKSHHVVLDGHTVVETASSLIVIPSDVFRSLGVTKMIFLADDPRSIARRRAADSTRNRPIPNDIDIRRHQDTALLAAFYTCFDLRIPLGVFTPDREIELESFLFYNADTKLGTGDE